MLQWGFDWATLTYFLSKAGFCSIERVGDFNVGFVDTSAVIHMGRHVSLNIVARACTDLKHRVDFSPGGQGKPAEVAHKATPYISI